MLNPVWVAIFYKETISQIALVGAVIVVGAIAVSYTHLDQPGGSDQPGTSGERHRVTIESNGNGSVSLENNSLMAGETVIFYAWPNQNAYFKNAYAVDANNNTLPCEYDSQTQQGQLTMPDCDIRIIVEFSKQPDFPDPVNPVYSVEEILSLIHIFLLLHRVVPLAGDVD